MSTFRFRVVVAAVAAGFLACSVEARRRRHPTPAAPRALQAYSPFTQVSAAGLQGVADVADGFGSEDKMSECTVSSIKSLVYIDLDAANGERLQSLDGGATWIKSPIVGGDCGNALAPLFPRTNAYIVGAVKSFGTGGNDRLLVIGGSDGDSSVFYSDDCGASWTCNNSTEVFTAARYRWLVDVPGVSLPYAPLLFGGGYAEPDGPGMLVPSIGVFVTADAGITWNRPLCVDQSNPGVTCTNPVPDEKRGGFAWAMSDTPTAPGMIARDSTTVYFFNAFPDPGADPVQYLNVSNYKIGWLPLPNGNTDGMYGRKAWLQGGSASVGCWFSTDYDADDLYVETNIEGPVNSMNQYAIASSAAGPWTRIAAPAPWAPRGGAVLLPMEEAGYKYALFGAGLSFNNGQPSEPTFGDVWKIDAGVCLANAATGLVCSGHGTPDLNALTCACDAAWQGDKLCSTCTPDGTRYGPDCLTCPAYNGSPCNAAAGGGVCDVARGCVCAAGYGPGTAACAPLPPPPPGYSPFTRLSINGLAGVMDPANGFGAEDKMVECNGAVVFIDLDANAGFRLRTLNGGRTWTSTPVMGGVCDNGSPPLYPRNNGYTVGVTKAIATGGDDRLVIIGGDTTENNVYISDDCGASWTCLDAAEVFGASEFRWMIDVPGVNIPYMPLIFGGGYVADDIVPGDITPSIGVFETFDGGVTWNRPQCTDQSNPGVTCTNPVPDEKRGGVAWAMSDIPTTSGMIARDSSTVWFFNPTADLDPGEVPVQYLNASNWRVGWQTVPGSTTANMFGRKAWLQGGSFKVGCWFSTDYDTDTMFVEKNREGAVNSMNQFSIAASAAGPWRVISSPAPWAPRAGAVLLPMEEAGYRYALFGAGMDFGLDVPGAPLFGDVWRIDAGVCMMDDAGVVCSGHGAPDLDTLAACLCDAGWGGDARCASCTPGTTYGPDCKLCQTTEDGSVCNAARGGGRCDSTAGCVCNPGFGPASTGCASPLTPAAATPAAAGPSPGAIAGGVLGALAAVGAAFAVVRVYGADAVGRAVARGASAAYSAVGSAAAAAAAAVAPAGERASERASLIGAGSAPSFSAAAASSASYGSSSASSASAKSSSSSASSPTTASAKAARVMSSEAAAARFGSLAKPGGAPAGAYNSDSA